MAFIVYYTKLGCLTSAKQVDLLRQSGHEVEVRDLLAHPWLPAELTSYFGDKPVQLWFNPNSPRVKSGEIDPTAYTSAAALSLMLEDHLLIRRPLMESGGQRVCGFEPATVHAWVGLASPEEAIADSAHFQVCSQNSTAAKGDASDEKCH
ncbi:MAG TPA: arsenate reductase family protein [Desulfuromonadales bacterium]|nr:arsenate reductase family protein [Desulfuromonadales bacterium]